MSPQSDSPRFGRVVTAMVTPFDDAGALDLEAAIELSSWWSGHGSDGPGLSSATGQPVA
jgi:4-hydroxy-tetrahydrodipicolinate synthase